MRWMENVKPEHNGGGWFDWIDCIHNIGYYLEQAYLTAFSKAKELMLFSLGGLKNTPFIPALGHELEKLDTYLNQLGILLVFLYMSLTMQMVKIIYMII